MLLCSLSHHVQHKLFAFQRGEAALWCRTKHSLQPLTHLHCSCILASRISLQLRSPSLCRGTRPHNLQAPVRRDRQIRLPHHQCGICCAQLEVQRARCRINGRAAAHKRHLHVATNTTMCWASGQHCSGNKARMPAGMRSYAAHSASDTSKWNSGLARSSQTCRRAVPV